MDYDVPGRGSDAVLLGRDEVMVLTRVRFEVRDRVMDVVLDGEPTLNSLSPATLDDFDVMLEAAERDVSLRAVVIRGAGGRAFCVGMDIDFLGECFGDPERVFVPFLERYHAILDRLERLPVLVVAHVAGLARAGGFELLLACDVVLVADDARVGDVHVAFGVLPGGGASQRAARKLGDQRAKALLLSPMWLDGPTMVRWGLALETHAPEDLPRAVEAFIDPVRGHSRPVVALTKGLIAGAPDVTLRDGLARELAAFRRFLAEVPDHAEGYRAFVEKRDPEWGDADVRSLV